MNLNLSQKLGPSPLRDARDWHVDVIRGWAALAVVFLHARMVMWVGMRDFWATMHQHPSFNLVAGLLSFPVVWGSAGVAVFFVISGYCIHIGWVHKTVANSAYRMPIGLFWLRRIARIYPVLLAALLLTLLSDSISRRFSLNGYLHDIGLSAFLINILSIQGITGEPYGSNGALWTLSLEVQFYATYPIVLLMRKKIGLTSTMMVVLVANFVSALVFENHGILIFTSYWASWMLGACIAEAKSNGFHVHKTALFNGFSILLAAVGCAAFFKSHFIAFQLWAFAFAAWFLVARPKFQTRTTFSRIMEKFGEFSYSLYIIHLPLLVLIFSVFFKSKPQVQIWATIAGVAIVIPAAYIFHLLVERPAIELTSRLKGGNASKPLRSDPAVST